MANTVSILSYGNTFGELVTTMNSLAKENNDIAANNYVKPTGTLFLNDPGLSLQVANNAVIQGGLQVQGIGSYGYIQNNLRIDGQQYLTNTTISMIAYGQANVYGQLYANASANSVIAANNVTIGGNTYITGNVFTSNSLVVAANTTVGGYTLLNGATNVNNFLTVTQNAAISGATYTNRLFGNTSVQTPTAYVTGYLDAGTATSQLHIVTANNLTSSRGYIDVLQSNTSINTASANTDTLIARNSLSTPRANVSAVLDANSATGYINNLQVASQLSVLGNFVITGSTVYNSNTFTLNEGSVAGQTSSLTVNRGTSGANASIRWNEPQSYWDIKDTSTNTFYRIITTQQIANNLTTVSDVQAASAAMANTLNNTINAANTFLQAAVVSAGSYGNSAFLQANAAFAAANNVAPQIEPAFSKANSAYALANTSSNTFVGTSGQMNPSGGSVRFTSNNGIQFVAGGNTFFVNTPQGLRTTDTPTFAGLVLSSPLGISQGGTGATSAGAALQSLLPSTVGVPSGYVLGTTGGLGASFNWVAGGTGGGGGAVPGTRITTNRLTYTANVNQTLFTTPTYTTGSGQLRVFIDGVRQFPSEYIESSNNTVTLNNAPGGGSTVFIEVDGYASYAYYANNITFTAPFGGIDATANTIQLAIESIESRKASLTSPALTGVPTSSTPTPWSVSNTWIATTQFVHSVANSSATFQHNITGNAGTVTNGVYTNGSYTDPSWLTLTKAKVGLNNVDNTADVNKSVNYANTSGSSATSTTVVNGGWQMTVSGNKMVVSLNGVNMFSVDSSGNVVARGNITAYGNP